MEFCRKTTRHKFLSLFIYLRGEEKFMKNFNKILTVTVAGATVFTLVGCNSKTIEEKKTEDVIQNADIATEDVVLDGDDVQIANPWSETTSLSEATSLAGFEIIMPENINGTSISLYRVIENETFEIRYGEDIAVRKSVDSGDISGDYNDYENIEEVDGVTYKGNGDTYNCITWSADGYSYSITSNSGLSLDVVNEAINSIK